MSRTTPVEIASRKRFWQNLEHMWSSFYYGFSILGILSSLAVAGKLLLFSEAWLSLLSWISSACMILLSFLRPDAQAKAFRGAWRILEDRINQYKSTQKITKEQLYQGVTEGEKFIDMAKPF